VAAAQENLGPVFRNRVERAAVSFVFALSFGLALLLTISESERYPSNDVIQRANETVEWLSYKL
jgi:hypothetical protein